MMQHPLLPRAHNFVVSLESRPLPASMQLFYRSDMVGAQVQGKPKTIPAPNNGQLQPCFLALTPAAASH